MIDQWWDRADYTELWAYSSKGEMKKEHGLKDEDIGSSTCAQPSQSYCLERQIQRGNSGLCQPNREGFAGKWFALRRCLGLAKQVGPQRTKWLPPSTPNVIAETKQKAILMVPCLYHAIETLDEIDIGTGLCRCGYHFARVDCFNMEEKVYRLMCQTCN